jgi:hypothetical protein
MSVNRYRSNEDSPECPNCGYEAFCVIENGGVFSIDTIGRVYICSTSEGTFLHSWRGGEEPSDIEQMADSGM